jgi:hypothetical protein
VITRPPPGKELKNTEQLADAPLPDSAHGLPPKLPAPLSVKLTVPVGVDCPALAVSVTVALQTVASPGANTLGEQLTPVAVACMRGRGVTAIKVGSRPVATVGGVFGVRAPPAPTSYWDTVASRRLAT